MQEKDIQGILQKVEELKELFSIGERFVPFLEDLSLFVKEMASRLIEMNEAIQERSAEMPSADQQLDKVIGAPEGTAQEVLGKIEEMLSGLEEISSDFQVVSKRLAAEREAISEITSNIEELLKLPNARKSLSKVFEDKKARNKGMKIKEIVDNFLSERVDDEVPQKMEQLLQNTQNRAYDIMNALQDRDTAARQVKAAQGLLRTVEERLNELINKYSETEPPGIAGEEPAADTGAAFLESEEHRKLTDQVAEESRVEEETLVEKEEEEPEEKAEAVEAVASQEEIDSLFDSVESVGPAIEESFIPESKSFEYSPGQTQSPEEIDQILGEAVGVEAEEAAGESAAFTLGEELETAPVAEEEAEELPEAVEELEEAPEAAEEHEELPVAEEEAGELPEAVEELEEAPEAEKELEELPVAEEEAGELPEAVEELEEAPEAAEELEELPVAEEEAGELPEAVEELEEAPEAAEEHEELPVAEEEAVELPEAVEELEEAPEAEKELEELPAAEEELEELPVAEEEAVELPEAVEELEKAPEAAEEVETALFEEEIESAEVGKSDLDEQISINQEEIDKLFK